MSRITIDAGLSETLRAATGPVDLCDPAGRVLGRYVPDGRTPAFSDEEIARWKSEGPGRPLGNAVFSF